MLSILNELKLQKELQNCMTNNVKTIKGKTKQEQNKKANIKILVRDGNRTRTFSHHSVMRYLYTTKTTKRID